MEQEAELRVGAASLGEGLIAIAAAQEHFAEIENDVGRRLGGVVPLGG